jgi:uncharacterized SAM-binding protein YcdF (DUF218 family)
VTGHGRWLWRLGWLALFGVLCLALYLCRAQLLLWAGQFLDVSDPPRGSDYVLVLGGGCETRPFVAAALVKSGRARTVLVPTTGQLTQATASLVPPEHEIIRRVLVARGVPADSIVLLPGAVSSTLDEARALREFLDEHPDSTVAVVTHPFHTRRARVLFGRVLGPRLSQLHFVTAPAESYGANNWWQTENGTVAYLSEYVKLAYCLLGG